MNAARAMMRSQSWCVVGDVLNAGKVASRIGPHLEMCGKTVVCVNPSSKTVESETLKQSLGAWECHIDTINLIINPAVGKGIVEDAIARGIKQIWIQPGAASGEILRMCEQNGVEVHQGCVLVDMCAGGNQ
jgi:predicted CoA-binding protein